MYRTLVLLSALLLGCATPAFAQHQHGQSSEAAAPITVGTIEITAPFTRATLPNAPVAGGFLSLTNTGTVEDRLISATSPISQQTQIHEMSVENDVMRMRELPDGLVIPPGETVVLEPGGFHLMFMGLTAPVAEGDVVPVTLTFEQAGTITIELTAGGMAADAPAHDHGAMQHGGGDEDDGVAGHAATHHGTATIDQAGMSDVEAITALQAALFDTPGNPLEMGPIVVSGEYAVSDSAQAGSGGRALLRKTADGWAIHQCAGADLKDAANLARIGVPQADAEALATQLAQAEAELPPAQIELYDSFNGVMMIDEELI